MIGIGKWKLNVTVPFIKGDPILTIADNEGKYEFTVDSQGFGITPALHLVEAREENSNTLRIKAQVPMLNVGDISGTLTFEGMYVKGEMEIPLIGKIAIKGERIG